MVWELMVESMKESVNSILFSAAKNGAAGLRHQGRKQKSISVARILLKVQRHFEWTWGVPVRHAQKSLLPFFS
jgi:hypothetical protein